MKQKINQESMNKPGVLNLAANEKNHKYTARYCMDNGFKLNLQMHLYAGLS